MHSLSIEVSNVSEFLTGGKLTVYILVLPSGILGKRICCRFHLSRGSARSKFVGCRDYASPSTGAQMTPGPSQRPTPTSNQRYKLIYLDIVAAAYSDVYVSKLAS